MTLKSLGQTNPGKKGNPLKDSSEFKKRAFVPNKIGTGGGVPAYVLSQGTNPNDPPFLTINPSFDTIRIYPPAYNKIIVFGNKRYRITKNSIVLIK